MGCDEEPQTENDPDDNRRNNSFEDTAADNIEKIIPVLESDEKVENFFNKNNEERELSAFLVNIESIHYYNGQSNKEILDYIINSKNIEIYSDYEKCKDISDRKNESDFFIVSKDYMKNKYKDYEKIKDKKVKIKKKKGIFGNFGEKKKIEFKKKENGLYSFISEFNHPSNFIIIPEQRNHYFYYIKFK